MPAQRYRDWLQQACWDLDHARAAVREGHFEWAAFAAEQAAGKALKALHIFLRGGVWSHDLPLLMESLPSEYPASPDLLARAKALHHHYLSSRFPTMHPQGTPRDHYTQAAAAQAIADAEVILDFARRGLPQ
jgi:HEPN domain-containing protein